MDKRLELESQKEAGQELLGRWSGGPCETPVEDLLRAIPRHEGFSYETQWAEDGTATGHASFSGELTHKAAETIEKLRQQVADYKERYQKFEMLLCDEYQRHNEGGIMTAASKHFKALELAVLNADSLTLNEHNRALLALDHIEQLQAAVEKAHQELFTAGIHSNPSEIMKHQEAAKEHLKPFVETE